MKNKPKNMQKVTMLLFDDDVKYLDEIALQQLTGSRGRSIAWIIRKYKQQSGESVE